MPLVLVNDIKAQYLAPHGGHKLGLGVPAPVSAHEPAAKLPPQAKTDCSGDIPVVMASDAAAQSGGYLVGGIAAVPEDKVRGRDLQRIAGADRWATAALVGEAVAKLTSGGSAMPGGSISGSGNAVKVVTLSLGRWLVEASVTGNESDSGVGTNFIVTLTAPNGEPCELVANEIGTDVRDSAVVQVSSDGLFACPPGEFAFEIDAAGDWTVTFTKR